MGISNNSAILIFARIPLGLPATEVMMPIPRSSLRRRITSSLVRSDTSTPNFFATYFLASASFILREICIQATRSPAVRMPPIPEAIICDRCIPKGSPTPIYNPSILPILASALDTRETVSNGGLSIMGTPPTPIPTLT